MAIYLVPDLPIYLVPDLPIYLVLDLPNIKGFSSHLWNSILIVADDASYA